MRRRNLRCSQVLNIPVDGRSFPVLCCRAITFEVIPNRSKSNGFARSCHHNYCETTEQTRPQNIINSGAIRLPELWCLGAVK